MSLKWVMKMFKKISAILMFFLVVLMSGCSAVSDELLAEVEEMKKKNEETVNEIEKYKEIDAIFDFYNNLTTENIKSFVLVESYNKETKETRYTDGVVIAQESLYFYVLADYNVIKQSGDIEYNVIDANAKIYKANLIFNAHGVVYDTMSGFVLLKLRVSSLDSSIAFIQLGNKSDIVANVSSIEQLNKIQVYDNIKTSILSYNNASYKNYLLEGESSSYSGALINSSNNLFGLYSSKNHIFMGSELIKEILFTTYSLVV